MPEAPAADPGPARALRVLAIPVAAVPGVLLVQALGAWALGPASPGKVGLATAALLGLLTAFPIVLASSERLAGRTGAKRLLLLEAACGVALLLAEGGLRVVLAVAAAHPAPCPRNIRMETDLSAIAPGVTGKNAYTTNSRGYRGPEPSPEDAIRVVAIGGSTTECFYLDDAEEWPARTAAALAGATGRKVRLWNAGRSGQTTLEHLLQIRRLPDVEGSDAVVVLCGFNDLQWQLAGTWGDREKDAEDRAFWNPLRRWSPSREPGLPWFERSRLHAGAARTVREGLEGRDQARELIQDTTGVHIGKYRALRASLPRRDDLPDLGPALKTYASMLGQLADAARERGTSLLLLTQPTVYADPLDPAIEKSLWFGVREGDGFAWSAGALSRGIAAYNEVMVRVAAEKGVPCVRLDGELPRDAVSFYDDCHFTEEGARRVAALVAPALRTLVETRGPRK